MTTTLGGAQDHVVRKAQLAGGSTFTVSLPKEWANRQGLTAGAELWLYPLEDRIVVAPRAAPASRPTAIIEVNGLVGDAIERRVRAAYTAGCERIVVTRDGGLGSDHRPRAREALEDLVGVEVEAADDAVEARSLLDTGEISLAQTLAQLRRLATVMHADAATAVVEADAERASRVRRQAGDVDRLVALVTRQFTGALVDVAEVDRLGTDRATAERHQRTARRLGDIAGDAARIAGLVEEVTGPPPPTVAEALHDAAAALGDMVGAALDADAEALAVAQAALRSATAAVEPSLEDVPAPDALAYGRLLERYRTASAAAEAIDRVSCRAEHLGPGHG